MAFPTFYDERGCAIREAHALHRLYRRGLFSAQEILSNISMTAREAEILRLSGGDVHIKRRFNVRREFLRLVAKRSERPGRLGKRIARRGSR
jgi:hypothetical protein